MEYLLHDEGPGDGGVCVVPGRCGHSRCRLPCALSVFPFSSSTPSPSPPLSCFRRHHLHLMPPPPSRAAASPCGRSALPPPPPPHSPRPLRCLSRAPAAAAASSSNCPSSPFASSQPDRIALPVAATRRTCNARRRHRLLRLLAQRSFSSSASPQPVHRPLQPQGEPAMPAGDGGLGGLPGFRAPPPFPDLATALSTAFP